MRLGSKTPISRGNSSSATRPWRLRRGNHSAMPRDVIHSSRWSSCPDLRCLVGKELLGAGVLVIVIRIEMRDRDRGPRGEYGDRNQERAGEA